MPRHPDGPSHRPNRTLAGGDLPEPHRPASNTTASGSPTRPLWRASADVASGRRFVARNYQVNYAVSPTELLVTSGKCGPQTRTDDRVSGDPVHRRSSSHRGNRAKLAAHRPCGGEIDVHILAVHTYPAPRCLHRRYRRPIFLIVYFAAQPDPTLVDVLRGSGRHRDRKFSSRSS